MKRTARPLPRCSTARLTPLTVTRAAGSDAGVAWKNSETSSGTGMGRPSRSMQTKTNSAVATRGPSPVRVAVSRMGELGGPRTVAREHVHPGSPRQQVPAGPLEDPKKGRLIEMPESIAVIGIDDLLDVRDRHARCSRRVQRYAGPRRTRYYSAPCSQVRTR